MCRHKNEILFALGVTLFAGSAIVGTQAQRSDGVPGAQRFMEYCAGCHGADGRGGDKAPSLAAPADAAKRSDSELFRIVHDGTRGGMPPFAQIGDANIAALVQYVRRLGTNVASTKVPQELAVTGDVEVGRALYFGKGHCSNCHLMRGKGGFIAQNLTNYGKTRSAEEILESIKNPDNPLVPSSQVVTVRTQYGTTLTGVLRNEDAFSLAVQTEDGRFHLLARGDVNSVQYAGRSLMPRDYGTRLSSNELDDLVSFLIAESRETIPAKSAGR